MLHLTSTKSKTSNTNTKYLSNVQITTTRNNYYKPKYLKLPEIFLFKSFNINMTSSQDIKVMVGLPTTPLIYLNHGIPLNGIYNLI